MIFETHAHYDDDKFNEDRDAVICKAHDAGVGIIVNVGAELKGSEASVALADRYDFIYASVGAHPYDAENVDAAYIEKLRALSRHPKVVAIGEIGLDYNEIRYRLEDLREEWGRESGDNAPADPKEHDIDPACEHESGNKDYDALTEKEAELTSQIKEEQKRCFRMQMELAAGENLPVIIHDRDAHADTLEILKEYHDKYPELCGIVHCFSGSAEFAAEVVKLGYYVAFGGVVTFRNARKAVEAVRAVPDDRLLIETDSPYLAPTPHRGERNDSSYLPLIIDRIAEIRNTSSGNIERVTEDNARRLFGII